MLGKVLLIAALTAPIVGQPSLKVSPPTLFVGASIRVTCRVPPLEANREIEVGVEGYSRYTRQLDGLNAPITWQRIFEHIPCGAERVYCLVKTNEGRVTTVVAKLVVAGCDQP